MENTRRNSLLIEQADTTETEPLNLNTRRLSRRRRLLEVANREPAPEAETSGEATDNQHPNEGFPRSARQLTELKENSPDPQEMIGPRRIVRWKIPTRTLGIVACLLTIMVIYGVFTGSLSTPFTPTSSAETYPAASTGQGEETLTLTTSEDAAAENSSEYQESRPAGETTVWVHVAGAVHNPGIYELPANSRAAEALHSAGGATEEADLNRINLAQPITDGQQIYVLAQGETQAEQSISTNQEATQPRNQAATTEHSSNGVQPINLNTASAAELETLPRVGPATAAKIIEWREANGGFSTVEELDSVPGIGPTMLANLTPLVTV